MFEQVTTMAEAAFVTTAATPNATETVYPDTKVLPARTDVPPCVMVHTDVEPKLTDHVEGRVKTIFSPADKELVSLSIVKTMFPDAPAVDAAGTIVGRTVPAALPTYPAVI